MTLQWILLAAYAVVIAWLLYRDGAEYRAFKTLTETKDRQRVYARWLIKFFFLFAVGAFVSLALLGDLGTLTQMPAVFAPLHASLVSSLTGRIMFGVAVAVVVFLLLVTALSQLRVRPRTEKREAKAAVDVQPLLPRNSAERVWAALLSVNAGLSEELSFRLVLPLLLAVITGNVLLAFVIATAAFGSLHAYQGWVGVVMTAFIGAVMSVIYLATGSIWVAIALHAALDLNGLVLVPYLAARRAAKT